MILLSAAAAGAEYQAAVVRPVVSPDGYPAGEFLLYLPAVE